jgi:hypothetical protein
MILPVIHQTDLFRPHNDPDDHWDLACVYALAWTGDIELKGIVIDYPPPHHRGDPDVLALAQMNYLSGLNVPFSIGSSYPTTSSRDHQAKSLSDEGPAVRMIVETLKNASSPVVIHIAGSCRDMARAGILFPELFREKCAGIYLNAGTGSRQTAAGAELEYNVRLDPVAFKAIWEIPCPIYWLPCFEVITNQIQVSAFGSWYDFLQADILFHLSDKVQKYFAYALGKIQDPSWLDYLHRESDQEFLAKQAQIRRNMWCTAGFFHAAGKSIAADGKIRPRDQAGADQVFTFDPIEVQCDANGITTWSPAAAAIERHILHVRDVRNYSHAMTTAMRALLATLP